MIAEEDMVIAITAPATSSATGHRLPRAAARRSRRDGMEMKETTTSSTSSSRPRTTTALLHLGRQDLPPEGARAAARLTAVEGPRDRHLLPFRQDEQIRAVVQTRNFEESEHLVFATKKGMVKKTRLAELQHPAEGRRDHRDQPAPR